MDTWKFSTWNKRVERYILSYQPLALNSSWTSILRYRTDPHSHEQECSLCKVIENYPINQTVLCLFPEWGIEHIQERNWVTVWSYYHTETNVLLSVGWGLRQGLHGGKQKQDLYLLSVNAPAVVLRRIQEVERLHMTFWACVNMWMYLLASQRHLWQIILYLWLQRYPWAICFPTPNGRVWESCFLNSQRLPRSI